MEPARKRRSALRYASACAPLAVRGGGPSLGQPSEWRVTVSPLRLAGDDADRFMRRTSEWPRYPWLPVRRGPLESQELGLVFADDIEPPERGSQAVDCIRVFEATHETGIALMNPNDGAIDGSSLDIVAEYDSVEEMIGDGGQGD
jgi:hypothetical protein